MKSKAGTRLAIFDTFKTKGDDLTGEANRQRSIITILASNANPAEKTRTGISQRIAKKQEIAWKNIYSGIFRDMDEILLPMGIAEEHGRLPLKRGPKVLQEKGIPYYHLTKKGILIALSISEIENRGNLLKAFFSKSESAEKEFEKILSRLLMTSPNFTYSILQKYVKAFCDKKIKELLPFDLSKLREISDDSLGIQKEFLAAFLELSKQEKEDAIKFLNKITYHNQENAKH
ncbi:MAG: hypothetical protein ISR80_00345 [Nitrosopumilus sp.]|nr:hypothetical protein [Nitrosopumilus sp.]MDC4231056.1 hypothetical protein [Nitrosopumilus sp.]